MASSSVRYRRYTTDLNQSRPRTVTLVKDKSGFGFTLRHFIVYPPTNFTSGKTKELNEESVAPEGEWKLDCKNKPMDTIFIREVKEDSPAYHAGLNKGDRIIAINSHPLSGKSYSEIIHLILRSGQTLRLLVVPKEDDILQLYFASSAYQPVHRENKQHKYLLPSFHNLSEQQYRQPNFGTYPGRVHSKSKSPISRERKNSKRDVINYDCSKTDLYNDVLGDGLNRSSHPVCDFVKKENDISLHEKYLLDTSCFSEDEGFYHHPKELKSENLVELPNLKERIANFYYTLYRDQPSAFAFSSEDNLNYPIYMSDFDDIVHCDNMAESKSITEALHTSGSNAMPSSVCCSCQCDKPYMKAGDHSCDNVGDSECLCISNSKPSYWMDNKLHNSDEMTSNFRVDADSGIFCHKPGERSSISSTYDFRDNPNIPSINLVAQRRHQFESGNLLAESVERMNLYRSELSRMSRTNHTRIVSSRTAEFENKSLTSPTHSEKQLKSPDLVKDTSDKADSERVALVNHQNSSLDYENSNKQESMICDSESGQGIETEDFKPSSAEIVHRRKTVPVSSDQDDCHIVRRISYLRATANERMNIESDLSEEEEVSELSSPNKEYRIQKLKSFFGEKTPKVKQAIVPVDINDSTCDQEDSDEIKCLYGWVICKVVSLEGKRSSDRSWRHLWAILRNNILYLLKERREPSKGTLSSEEHVINIKYSIAKIANDYVKRKNVLRLLLLNGTEYLVQTESHTSMLEWLKAFDMFTKEIAELPEWLRNTSVLEKAKAYEHQIQTNKGKGAQQHAVRKLVFRHRTPSEHSPTVKSRRASQGDELALSKIGVLWRDRMLQGWKKVHGVNSHLPKGSSFGVKLENAPSGIANEHIPLIVELCVQIVETRGLDVVGIYRVPGNNASVSILTDMVNQGIDDEILKDVRWNDVNIVSSLLKAYFRKLPEPLLTSHLYPKFIQASEIDDPVKRLKAIKHVIYHLPVHYFATLRFLMYHLKKVVDHSATNKMEARNLAIVFGPTLVRATDNNMVAMVTDMPQQCYLIETMILQVEWLFEDCSEQLPIDVNIHDKRKTHPPSTIQSSALLNNIDKLDENSMDSLPHEMFASLCNAASRHLRHRHKKKDPASYSKKRSGIIADDADILGQSEVPSIFCDSLDLKTHKTENISDIRYNRGSPESSVSKEQQLLNGSVASDKSDQYTKEDVLDDAVALQAEADQPVGHKYNQLSALAQEKIRNFEQETKALLRRDVQRPPRASASAPQVEWEQIEKEWQKAKLELEQEDLLDYLADDPSYLSSLLTHDQEPKLVEFFSSKTDLPRSLSSGKELLNYQTTQTLNNNSRTQIGRADQKDSIFLTSAENSSENFQTKSETMELPMSISHPALASVFREKVSSATPQKFMSTSVDNKAKSNSNFLYSEESKKKLFHQMEESPTESPDSSSSNAIQSSNPS